MAVMGRVESTLFQRAGNHAACSFAAGHVAGMIFALGIFSRFTFVFVTLPTMPRFIADKATFRTKRALFGIGLLGVGFLGTSAGVLCADVKYYKGADQWTSYIAPLDALLYLQGDESSRSWFASEMDACPCQYVSFVRPLGSAFIPTSILRKEYPIAVQ